MELGKKMKLKKRSRDWAAFGLGPGLFSQWTTSGAAQVAGLFMPMSIVFCSKHWPLAIP